MVDQETEFSCRPGCGACCVVPSISSPLPDLPQGKAAHMRCPHLSPANLCLLFESPLRPQVCQDFRAQASVCGQRTEDAWQILTFLEQATQP